MAFPAKHPQFLAKIPALRSLPHGRGSERDDEFQENAIALTAHLAPQGAW